MAKVEQDQLFTLPGDMMADMDKAFKRLEVMKGMLPGFEELGQDVTQMKKDIALLEKQYKVLKGFTKPAVPIAIAEKK